MMQSGVRQDSVPQSLRISERKQHFDFPIRFGTVHANKGFRRFNPVSNLLLGTLYVANDHLPQLPQSHRSY